MTSEKHSLDPDEAAWLQGLMARSKPAPDEVAELDRVNQLATVAARRAAEAVTRIVFGILGREDGVQHFEAMMALGNAIAERFPSPFPVAPR